MLAGGADARMRMFIADGSESEMRAETAVRRHQVHDYGIAEKPTLTIETGRGVLSLELRIADGKVRGPRRYTRN
ncbi:MAG: hypothetical protein U0744_17360 [Gemmataceae bacterium]